MATAVATGTPCLDFFQVKDKGPVLIYLAEDSLPVVRERLEALAAARRKTLNDLDIHVITADAMRLDLRDDACRLAVTVNRLKPRLLLLDPFVRLHRADENNAGEVATILNRLRLIQRKYGTAVVLVHHTRKQHAAQHGQTLRGSGDLHAWGDSNLYLTHANTGLLLSAEHRAAPAPEPVHVALVGNPPHLTLVGEPEPSRKPIEERVLDALRSATSPIARTQLRQQVAVNNQKLGTVLVSLQAAGLIHRTPDGWTAP